MEFFSCWIIGILRTRAATCNIRLPLSPSLDGIAACNWNASLPWNSGAVRCCQACVYSDSFCTQLTDALLKSTRTMPWQATQAMMAVACRQLSTIWVSLFYRTTPCKSAVLAVGRCLSVRLSVRLSHSCIVSKRRKISSNFFSSW